MQVAVVGSGPNGLAAAITLAEAGADVTVFEQAAAPGGGCRSERIIFEDCLHDHCAAVLPLAVASPFFQRQSLVIDWASGAAALAHPLDDSPAVLLHRSIEQTAGEMGRDGRVYSRLMAPLAGHAGEILNDILRPIGWPAAPLQFARFGAAAMMPVDRLSRALFREEGAKALFAGLAAHAVVPPSALASASTALVLGMLGHSTGWPIPVGGAQVVTDRLVERLSALGGRIELKRAIQGMDELAGFDRVCFDTTPQAMVDIAGDALPAPFRNRLSHFKRAPGVFKVDWVLDGPIPWSDPRCAEAVTLHLGGTAEEIAESEAGIWQGKHSQRPLVILAQPSIVDPTRAPGGKQVVWGYCHVPTGSAVDMTDAIERQIERFAPGFRTRILGKRSSSAAALERDNPNLAGGDISGGAQTIGQILARPYLARDPYHTPNPRLFLASSSTPPGGGVHGMCGYNAARSLLSRG